MLRWMTTHVNAGTAVGRACAAGYFGEGKDASGGEKPRLTGAHKALF
jgi:hypothetical protein